MAVAKVAYFPGCSLEGFGKSYDESAKFTARALGVELATIDDYSCCGAIEAKREDELSSYLLPARNLALAKKQMNADSLVTPCNGCHYTMRRATTELKKRPTLAEDVNRLLGDAGEPAYDGKADVRHFLEYLFNEHGPDAVKAKVKRPLKGLKVVPYYGCLYVRPKIYSGAGKDARHDNPEYPVFMDELLRAAGAEVVEWDGKTDCCGGGHALGDEDNSLKLSASVLERARQAGADVLTTNCPLCGAALDVRYNDLKSRFGDSIQMPVTYFTQLLGLAFGGSAKDVGLGLQYSGASEALKKRGVV